MNLFQLVLLGIIGFANLALGMIVFLRNRKARTNQSFLVFTILFDSWMVFNYLCDQPAFSSTALFNNKMTMTFGALMSASLLYFALSFSGGIKKISLGIKLSLAAFTIIFSLLNWTKMVVRGIEFFSWGTNIILGPLFPLSMGWGLFCILTTLIVLFRHYFKGRKTARMQLRYLFTGLLIFLFTSATLSLILPFITGLNNLAKYSAYPVIFFIGFTTFAIVKHRLMDIRILVMKSVAYSLTLAIIAGLYALDGYLLLERFQGFVSQIVFNVFIIFIAVVGFVPLKRLIEKYTDRIFAKGRYNFEDLLEKLGKLMSTKVVLEDLTTSTLETLVKEMRLTRAAFLIAKDSRVAEVEAMGYKSKSVSFWDKATRLVAGKKGIVISDELEEGSKEKEILRRLNAEILLPIIAEESLVGVLALGEKRSGDMFASQDIRLLEIIAPEAAIAVSNASLFKEKEKRIEELNSLNKLALSLGSTLHLDQLLEEVMDEAIKVTEAETGSIMLLDEETRTLRVKAARGIPPEVYRRAKAKVGEGIAGWVAKTSEPTMIIDSEHENKYLQKCLKREEITSALSVPLKIRNKVIGVLSVNRKKKKEVFTEEALNLMTSYAAQAAEAIENARLFEKSERQFMETITTLSGTVEAKDPYTRGHSDAVTEYAVSIAKEMGLPSEEIRNIEIAGRLHDIGKIGIPESILNKPGRLSKEEREIINQHPKISVDILKPAGSLNDIIPTILYHHERFDGKGYPTGLAGKAIPLGARILAAADSFNAMTTDRPYRPALSLGDTIRELKENAGGQFDPDVVEAMLKVLETSELKFKSEAKVNHKTKHVKPLTAVS